MNIESVQLKIDVNLYWSSGSLGPVRLELHFRYIETFRALLLQIS